ncbi:MAG: response regulator [Bdellovibrionales bacterium]|nr:response regulator [Bdellovibrionales bacterium]
MNSNYKILLVEDDSFLRTLLFELLEGEGFQCVQAEDGLAARTILETQHFDLLITDFRMPRMDGSELLEWCRKSKIHFPVIFLTANTELLPKEKLSLEDCCAAVLQKPAGLDDILQAIRDAQVRNHNLMC